MLNKTVTLTFSKIESLISKTLPKSAYYYPAWWANGEKSHSHASAWQDAGYKVDEIKFGEYVVFKRIN